MPDIDSVRTWEARTMIDRDGGRIGPIDAIYLDDRTGEPEWALVNTGLFGTKASFVPLAQAAEDTGDVRVPYDKQLVKDAPRIDPDGHLSEAEERQLWRHYGLDYDRTTRRRATGRDTVGQDTSGPTTDDAMTRSEVEPVVERRVVPRERVRLDKDTVTGEEQVTEELRKEQIDLDDDGEVGRHEQRRRR